jgi:hypothetical protein
MSAASTKLCPECSAVVHVCDHLFAIPKFHSPSDEGKAPAAAGNSQRRREAGSGSSFPWWFVVLAVALYIECGVGIWLAR